VKISKFWRSERPSMRRQKREIQSDGQVKSETGIRSLRYG